MTDKNANRRIDVLGSVNIDLVARVASLPLPGETVAGGDIRILLGGKGANQAIAAARAGGGVTMWGAVGAQSFGLDPLAEISAAGVDVSGVAVVAGATGAALIGVDEAGENSIIVSPGVNALAETAVDPAAMSGGWVLAQMETPPAFTARVFAAAKARGARTALNAAPALDAPPGLFAATDLLIVNETELARYSGHAVGADADAVSVERAARSLRRGGDQTVIVTLGARGALAVSPDGVVHAPAVRAQVVDTTGAGDCFCGALVAALADGAALAEAMRFAAHAAALSVARAGASTSMPDRAEIGRSLRDDG